MKVRLFNDWFSPMGQLYPPGLHFFDQDVTDLVPPSAEIVEPWSAPEPEPEKEPEKAPEPPKPAEKTKL